MGAMWSLLWGWWTAGTQVSSVQYAEDGDLGPEGDVADPTTGLTLRHRTAMVRTWDMVRPDMKVHGINFFLTLFRAEPELQTRFKGFADKTEEELKTNKRLAAHASTVMLAITGLVDNLDDVTCLVEMLNATALNHKRRGVPKKDFELLAPVLVKFLRDSLGSAWTPIAEEAWTQALKVINTVIFGTYDSS
ncbi:globin [Penaeus vannamei]|uniref:Cytoglobin n=1 Tax=Penaeus vannamei TaxID=6689 RepID=A0A221SE77_PENVA|nr:globin-like [Penaeus vannamei]ASN74468.1 cytoglobin [Penaeus vannamei]